jgi:hypothetical protein
MLWLTTHERMGERGAKNTRGSYLCVHHLKDVYYSCATATYSITYDCRSPKYDTSYASRNSHKSSTSSYASYTINHRLLHTTSCANTNPLVSIRTNGVDYTNKNLVLCFWRNVPSME